MREGKKNRPNQLKQPFLKRKLLLFLSFFAAAMAINTSINVGLGYEVIDIGKTAKKVNLFSVQMYHLSSIQSE